MLNKVGPQRLRDELILILKEGNPIKPIKRLYDLEGFRFLSNSLPKQRIDKKIFDRIQKEINWFKAVHCKRRPLEAWIVYLMGIFDRFNKAKVQLICKNFAFKKGESKRILSVKSLNQRFVFALNKTDLKPAIIFKMLKTKSDEEIIMIKAKYRMPNLIRHIEDFLEIYNDMCLSVSGDDLRRLGVTPGPFYEKIFSKILNAKLNGEVSSKESELALLKKIIRNH